MRRLPAVLAILVGTMTVWAQQDAQPAAVVAEEANAALLYWSYREAFPHEVHEALSIGYTPEDPEWLPNDEVSFWIKYHKADVKGLIRTANLDRCEWARWDDGLWGQPGSHVRMLQQVQRILAADARRLAQAGEVDAVGDRILAMLRMPAHVVEGSNLYLFAEAGRVLATRALYEIEAALEHEALSDADKAQAVAALDAMAKSQVVELFEAASTDQRLEREELRRICVGDDAGEVLADWLDSVDPEIRTLTEAQIAEQLDLAAEHARVAAELADEPNAESKLEDLDRRVDEGEFDMIVRPSSLPSVFFWRKERELREHIDRVRELLNTEPNAR